MISMVWSVQGFESGASSRWLRFIASHWNWMARTQTIANRHVQSNLETSPILRAGHSASYQTASMVRSVHIQCFRSIASGFQFVPDGLAWLPETFGLNAWCFQNVRMGPKIRVLNDQCSDQTRLVSFLIGRTYHSILFYAVWVCFKWILFLYLILTPEL